MGQLLIEGHALPPTPELFIDIMHTLLLVLHPFQRAPTLHPVPIVAMHLHLLGNVLEHVSVAVPLAKLVLGLRLTSSHLPMAPVV